MAIELEKLKQYLGIDSKVEQCIAQHSDFLMAKKTNFHATFQAWALENQLINTPPVNPVFTPETYAQLVQGIYDDDYYSIIYDQGLTWYHDEVSLTKVSLFFSKTTQILIGYAQEIGDHSLILALGLIVDFSRILILDVFRLSRDLDFLKQRSYFEIKRIEQAFSLLTAPIHSDIVQTYIAHQEWNIKLFALALNIYPEQPLSLHDIEECSLTLWLKNGGENLIPSELRNEFHIKHAQLHETATQIVHYALKERFEKVAHYLKALEVDAHFISSTLLSCIDTAILSVATHDPLTKLRNRTTMDALWQKESAFAQRFEHQIGLILIDIDHFKRVNDTYGHTVGDLVLVQLSQLLDEQIRPRDEIFRWGGEELVILGLFQNEQEQGAAHLAERLRVLTAQHIFGPPENPFHITISLGATQYAPAQLKKIKTLEHAFGQADTLLYKAKEGGRNQVQALRLE